jgi:hypothetical protein
MKINAVDMVKKYTVPVIIVIFGLKPATQEIIPVLFDTIHNIYLSSKNKEHHFGISKHSMSPISGGQFLDKDFTLTIIKNKIGKPKHIRVRSASNLEYWLSNDLLSTKSSADLTVIEHMVGNDQVFFLVKPRSPELEVLDLKNKTIQELMIYTKGEFYIRQGRAVIGFSVLVFLCTVVLLTTNLISVDLEETIRDENVYFKHL